MTPFDNEWTFVATRIGRADTTRPTLSTVTFSAENPVTSPAIAGPAPDGAEIARIDFLLRF